MTENLIIMLLDLLSKDKVTAKQLAQKLEVSERTIYRYMDTLSLSNIPVYTQKGRFGGIKIGEEFKINAMCFSKEEKACILAALDNFKQSADISIINTSIDKLSVIGDRCNPSKPRAYRNEHFIVDNKDGPGTCELSNKIDAIVDAKKKNLAICVQYHDYNGDISERIIEPHTLVFHDNNWYVYSFCRMRNSMRLFKISRITHIYKTDSPYIPKKHNNNWRFNFNNPPQNIDMLLKISPEVRYDAEEWLGIHNVLKADDGINYIASGSVPDDKTTYSRIIGYGCNATILSPDSLKQSVKELCLQALQQ